MPLILYGCKCGHVASKMYKKRSDAPAALGCSKCDSVMLRKLAGPALASTITVDNGVQGRAVEVNLEVVESNKENSKKDFREK